MQTIDLIDPDILAPRGWLRAGTLAEERRALFPVAEPCTLRSTGGRVRDGLVREAGLSDVVITGVGGLVLGQQVEVVLPRRAGLRLRASIAGVGLTGLLVHLCAADRGVEWHLALRGMTDGGFRTG